MPDRDVVMRGTARTPIRRCGGAIALGHLIGGTGTRLVAPLLHESRRRGEATGIATLCVSGGMGMAMGIEVLL